MIRFNQVVNKENVSLVLVEIKRDVADIRQRKGTFEFQAIRYTTSYAKIKTTDEIVDKINSN